MRIGDVPIPQALEDARREGRLVLFVGAGASMGPPTKLPDFKSLVEQLEADAGRPHETDPDLVLGLDHRLGRLADAGYAVHANAAARIEQRRKPNQMHAEIRRLAATAGQFRVVTTNFDAHLEAPGPDANERVYVGPALPMGDDFEGLTYLHGRLGNPPESLILTDADFGRAYLTDAWAARFVERMYREYSVLFLGYSLGDPVMQYAVRGMRSGRQHFALVAESQAERWSPYDLTLLRYPQPGGGDDHDQALRTLSGWADRVEGGWLDQRERVVQLVAQSAASLNPEEADFVADILKDDRLTTFFVETADSVEWLTHLVAEHDLGAVLTAQTDGRSVVDTFGRWAASTFIESPQHSDVLLKALADAGGRMSPALRWHVARAVCLADTRSDHLRAWLLILAEQCDGGDAHWLERALRNTPLDTEWRDALHLLEILTRPRARPQSILSGVEVFTYGSQHAIRSFRERLKASSNAALRREVTLLAERQLARAAALASTPSGWDPWSSQRDSIADAPSDRHRDVSDELIDLARMCLLPVLADQPAEGQATIDRWATGHAVILRRLAVYIQGARDDLTDRERLEWFVARPWRYAHDVHTEIYGYMARMASTADASVVDELVADIVSVADESDMLRRLLWIQARGASSSRLIGEVDRLQAVVGPMELGDHEARTRWIRSGTYVPVKPMSVEHFVELVRSSPRDAVNTVTELAGTSMRFDGEPDWEGALELLQATAATAPREALTLLEIAGQEPEARQLIGRILSGFGEVADASLVDQIALAVGGLQADHLDSAAYMLRRWHHQPEMRGAAFASQVVRDLVRTMWERIDLRPVDGDVERPMDTAINDAAGTIAEYWVRAALAENVAEDGPGQGLANGPRSELERMLDDDRVPAHLGIPVIASQLHPLHYVEPEWALARVLPLLDFNRDRSTARAAWDGYLTQGRFGTALLDAGLRDAYLQAAVRIDQELPGRIERYADHVAESVTLLPPSAEWLTDWTSRVSLDVRLHFLDRVAWLLGNMDENRGAQWDAWLDRYWGDRLAGRGAPLVEPEQLALVAVGSEVTERSELVLTRAMARPAPLASRHKLFFHLRQAVDRNAQHVQRLLLHVLRGTSQPERWSDHELRELTRRLRDDLGAAAADELRNAALEAGFSDAGEW